GSLRAKVCLEGNRAMRDYCREHGLPLIEPGKVIVARNEAELPTLLQLFERATINGAEPRLIDEQELAEIEPNARTTGHALFSPFTSQVDPQAVLAELRRELTASGKVRFLFETRFLNRVDETTIRTTAGDIRFAFFVNAAGAHADRVAHPFGLGRDYVLVPFKGLYRKLKKGLEDSCRGSIYPVPDIRNPFLGIHFTRSVHGDVYLGPTAIPAFGRENYGILRGMDAEAPAILWRDAKLFFTNPKFRQVALTEPRKYCFSAFFNDAKKLVKQLDPADIEPSTKVGIRPQLVNKKTGELVMDFVIEQDNNSIHVLNAISPAFTSAFSFAKIVTGKALRE
ncbi:MAG: FAD-dependent oxidoreductase, partial [Proteobacteria bacterium]|nr:FAD-dependent oxidoreductase [Pseudomonadota bacterium]